MVPWPLASPRPLSGPPRAPSSYATRHGNWAYESIPIDITGNGTHLFDFGPVPASFDYPSNPKGLAFDWPSDGHFSVVPANSVMHTVTLRGKRYFQIGFSIFHFSSPYRGYRAWMY